jgi:hypothetical protein
VNVRRVLVLALASVACAPAAPPSYAQIPPAHVVPVWSPVRYAAPTCPLAYEQKTTETDKMDDGPPGFSAVLETLVRFELRPDRDHVTLGGTVTTLAPQGKYRYYTPPNQGYADVHLETDGLRWIERDGPTNLFDHIGTQGGLVWFFPDLPPTGEPEATVEWTIPPVDDIAMLRTEVARGKQRGIAETLMLAEADEGSKQEKPERAVTAKVRLERHVDVQGVPAAELSLTADTEFSEEHGQPFGTQVRAKMSQRGKLTVLQSGQILRADLERVMTMDMAGPSPGSSQHHVLTSTRQLRLVGACGGPTEPSLVVPLSREERAIAAWGQARSAFARGDRTKFLEVFEPSLVAKHGAEKLWTALVGFKTDRGDFAIPPISTPNDDDVLLEGAALHLRTYGTVREKSASSFAPIEVVVTMHESDGQWRVESLRGALQLDPRTLVLDVSPQRLLVKKGWPPK